MTKQTNRLLISIFSLLPCFLLISCASEIIHSYGELELPSSNVGILKGPYHIKLVSIDGDVSFEKPDCTGAACTAGFEIYFTSGVHYIEVQLGDGMSRTLTPSKLTFMVEAGHEYLFTYTFKHRHMGVMNPNNWKPQIEDSTNEGKVVSTLEF